LRIQAQKKANALLRCIPGGVVIVDANMRIVECNEFFANMFDAETAYAFEARPGLAGANIEKIAPLGKLIKPALENGKDITREFYRIAKRMFNVTVFTIEPRQAVGLIIMDVTGAEIKREQIAERAKAVIDKNLSAVQEIACLLGEHVADTEILLRSIADDFSFEDAKEGGMQ
jgi:PAS domain-containing protein